MSPSGGANSRQRTAAHAIASAVTIFFLVASVASSRSLDRLLWSLPHILANVSQLVLLTLATLNRPQALDQSPRAFTVGVLGTISPIAVASFGAWLPLGDQNHFVAVVGRYLNVAVIPLYLLAIWTLGRNLTVLPEASSLRTGGIYSISRHPLYAIYMYWYVVQNLIFQSWASLALSCVQAWLTVDRARLEEQILEKHFPEYEDYRRRVSWFGRTGRYARVRPEQADIE